MNTIIVMQLIVAVKADGQLSALSALNTIITFNFFIYTAGGLPPPCGNLLEEQQDNKNFSRFPERIFSQSPSLCCSLSLWSAVKKRNCQSLKKNILGFIFV
jgi:hypothetical protein